MQSLCIKKRSLGAVLVEFAIILPILMFIILAIIELGWGLVIKNTLTDAAREGARVAVTQNVSTNTIISNIDSIIQTANIPTTNLTVSITPSSVSLQAKGTPIQVLVSLPYSAVSILPAPLFMGGMTLNASVTMAKEY